MTNTFAKIVLIISIFILPFSVFSSEDHDHEHKEEANHKNDHKGESEADHKDDHKGESEADHKDDHKGESGDDHKDDHKGESEADHKDDHKGEPEGEHNEASSSVGPDKGITEKSDQGLKLSVEAIKVMEIRMQVWSGTSQLVDSKTLVLVKDEKSVFRVREGWIKRVPVQVLKKSGSSILISSSELKVGDQIVNHGTGFLRIAEVFATEGATHAH